MRNLAYLVFFYTAGVSLAQVPALAAAPTTPGSISYHDNVTNLDFTYPAGFHAPKDSATDTGATDQDKSNGTRKADPGCVTVPVAVMDMRTNYELIFVRRYDLDCLSKKFAAVHMDQTDASFLVLTTATNLTHSLEDYGKPSVGVSKVYDVGGQNAQLATGSVKVPDSHGPHFIFIAESCILSGKNMACFEFQTDVCSTLAVLSASTVKFAEGTATPVVPVGLLPACKK